MYLSWAVQIDPQELQVGLELTPGRSFPSTQLMYSKMAVIWNTLAIVGHAGLLSVLLTLFFVSWLPQRRNPFYINLLVVGYLTSVPLTLLFVTGQQGGIKNQAICDAQAALMDGVAPALSVSLLVLAFQIWCELRAMIRRKRDFIGDNRKIRILLLGTPYILWVAWSLGSRAGTVLHQSNVELRSDFVVCQSRGDSVYSSLVRELVGPFCGLSSLLCILLAGPILVLSINLLTKRRWKLGSTEGSVWSTYRQHITVRILLRTAILTFYQIIPIILTVVNRMSLGMNPSQRLAVANATQISEACILLLLFVVSATQKNILQAWKLLPRHQAPIVDAVLEVQTLG